MIVGFFRARDHVTIEELTRSVRKSAPGIGAVTVYRTLKLPRTARIREGNRFRGGGPALMRATCPPHHDHLVCRQCGTVIEFEDREIEQLQDLVTRRHGFHPTAHRLEIYGFCRKCGSGKSPERYR